MNGSPSLMCRTACLLAGLAISAPINAEIEISQLPLSLVGGVDPNLIILFDNSVSMNSDSVGYDALANLNSLSSSYTIYPYINYVRTTSLLNYTGDTPCLEEFNILLRSTDRNPLYYNPNITYTPWPGTSSNAGSTEFANASPERASSDVNQYTISNSAFNVNLLSTVGTSNLRVASALSSAPAASGAALVDQCLALMYSYARNGKLITDNATTPTDYMFYTYTEPGIDRRHPYTQSRLIYYFLSNQGDYVRVRIQNDSNGSPSVYTKRQGQAEARLTGSLPDWLASNGVTRTIDSLDAEIQNYANWFQYYGNRINNMRGAIAKAAVNLPESVRVGLQFLDPGYNTSSGNVDETKFLRSIDDYTHYNTNQYSAAGGPSLTLRPMSGDNRTRFFDVLYRRPMNDGPAVSTTLREAFYDIGLYFSRSDASGPWSSTPGDTRSTGRQLYCRRNFAIITTDGYYGYNSTVTNFSVQGDRATGDYDTTTGLFSTVSGPNGQTCTFNNGSTTECNANVGRFHGSASTNSCIRNGTLADLAMYYWATDLRTDSTGNGTDCTRDAMCNSLVATSANPAFWQHLVTYAIAFGAPGYINPTDANVTAALDAGNGPGVWNGTVSGASSCPINPTGGNTDNVGAADDLFHAAINGHGRFTSALSGEDVKDAMDSILADVAAAAAGASATASTASSAYVQTDSLVFSATFDSTNWSGNLSAYNIDVATGFPRTTANWSAEAKMPTAANRRIYTAVPLDAGATGTTTTAKAFTTSLADDSPIRDLIASQAPARYSDGDRLNRSNRLINYLRGDASREGTNATNRLRIRERVNNLAPLGDIVDSDPNFVAQTNLPYYWDADFTTFRAKTATRTPMLYVGGNDGMLHAFRATQATDANGNVVDSSAGTEVFAYIPAAVLGNLGLLGAQDYADNHRFFVDGPIYTGDAKINSEWKTLLIGGLGGGGKAVYALDITGNIDGSSTVESTFGSADSVVKWEFTHPELGYTYGRSTLVHLKDGTRSGVWAAVVPNGYNSTSQKAKLFLLNADTGAMLTTDPLGNDTDDEGSDSTPNGLSTPLPVDLNGDGFTDYLYAGDLLGNLWRYDVRNTISIPTPVRVFQTPSVSSCTTSVPDCDTMARQPITSRPTVTNTMKDNTMQDVAMNGLVLFFGTGRYFAVGDQNSQQDQAFYAVLDAYGTGANSAGVKNMSTHTRALSVDDLVEKTIDETVVSSGNFRLRNVSPCVDADNNPTNPQGTICSPNPDTTPVNLWSDGKFGWYLPLPDSGERIVSQPLYRASIGQLLFSTLEPAQAAGQTCAADANGWVMTLSAYTGGAPTSCGNRSGRELACTIDINRDGDFTNADLITVGSQTLASSGFAVTGMAKQPGALIGDKTLNILVKIPGVGYGATLFNSRTGRQVSWRQLSE